MQPDFTIAQNDTSPILTDTLTYSNGQPANLTGATLSLVMRSLASATPVALTGTAAIVEPVGGKVSYTFSAKDTATVGQFAASWEVVLGGGAKMRWPTVGYIWISIEESLLTPGERLIVSLPEVKQTLNLPANDRVHDAELVGLIEDVQPLIEEHTGPIIPQTYDEWYEGGHSTISLRHKPSFGPGTSPLLNVLAVSEYRGPIEYNLSIVPTPTQGSVYSEMTHDELGLIVRRTSGGGTYNWWHDPSHPQQSVHVIYQAGQETVPRNVARAARETIRWWWMTTMAIGKGRETPADAEQQLPHVALPYHVVAMLSPTRRHPSLA
jgi:hypothetical protein